MSNKSVSTEKAVSITNSINRLYKDSGLDFISLNDVLARFKQELNEKLPDGFDASNPEYATNTTIGVIFNEIISQGVYEACTNESKTQAEKGLEYLRKFLIKTSYQTFGEQGKDDLDDISQTALIEIYKHLKNIQNPKRFLPYSKSVLRRTGIKFLRGYRIANTADIEKYAGNFNEEADVVYIDSNRALNGFEYEDNYYYLVDWEGSESQILEKISYEKVFEELPYLTKEILLLRMEKLSFKRIASQTGKSVNEVRSLISKAWDVIQQYGITFDDRLSKYRKNITKAYSFENLGEWNNAIKSYRHAISAIKNEFDKNLWNAEQAKVKFFIGKCLIKDAKWVEALSIFQDILKTFGAEKMYFWKAETYFYISYVFEMMNIFEPALLYYREAYHHYKAFKEESEVENIGLLGMARSKEYLGNLEFRLNILTQAGCDLQEAINLFNFANAHNKANDVQSILTNLNTIMIEKAKGASTL